MPFKGRYTALERLPQAMALPAFSSILTRIPVPLWKFTSILLGSLIVFALYLQLSEESISPGVRLAIAAYSCITFAAAKRAKWKLSRLYYKPWMGQAILFTVITGCIVMILLPVFIAGHNKAKESHAAHLLKTSGGLILEYAKFHGGQLPSDMNPRSVPALFKSQWDTKKDSTFIDPYTNNPIVWRHALSGRKIDKAKELGRIIMGYSPEPVVYGTGRLVCFLDGHVRWFEESKFKELLRQQPRLLSREERVQQEIRITP